MDYPLRITSSHLVGPFIHKRARTLHHGCLAFPGTARRSSRPFALRVAPLSSATLVQRRRDYGIIVLANFRSLVMMTRTLSSTAVNEEESSAFSSAEQRFSLRNMVKPFLLKCHPDMQQSESAKQTNLLAIQNLNAYIDTIQNLLSRTTTSRSTALQQNQTRLFEIDFVVTLSDDEQNRTMAMPTKKASKKKTSVAAASRRKVELVLPPDDLIRAWQHNHRSSSSSSSLSSRRSIERHAANQLVRLLKMAGLEVSNRHLNYSDTEGDDMYDPLQEAWEHTLDLNELERPHYDHVRFERTEYEKSRDRFTASINWKQYNKLYEKAMADLRADLATEGMIAGHPGRRREMIANMLAKVQLEEEIDVLEQLVALRRLSLLFDEHFETLHMERFGRLWEKCNFVLAPSRQFNTSASALYKRRVRMGGDQTGYSFTLHPDFSVTIHIPIDFRDDELIQELDRNLWDIYDLIDDGFSSLFNK